MKRFFLLAVVLSTLAFTISRPTISNFIFITVNDVPDLPDDPYEYSDITFPAHLLNADNDTIDLGYEGGGIDSLSFADVTDDGATLGRVLFYDKKLSSLETMSCATCHSQCGHNIFGDFFPIDFPVLEIFPFIFNNGLPENPDDAGAGNWEPGFSNLFKIPTLRNIDLTAPYMHDGRFEILEEVVNHYSSEVEANEWTGEFIPPEGFGFTDTEKEALIAFM